MRTSVGPETAATTLSGPNENVALASDLARVPSSAERGRKAVAEILLTDCVSVLDEAAVAVAAAASAAAADDDDDMIVTTMPASRPC